MKRHSLALWFALFAVISSSAQTAKPTRPDRGFYPNGSFSPSEFDTINNVNGNLIARVPITGLAPSRGGSQISVGLVYNSALYDTFSSIGGPAGSSYVYQALKKSEYGGWTLGYQYGLEYETRSVSGICSAAFPEIFKTYKMYLRTPDGSLHTLRLHPYLDVSGDGFYSIGPNRKERGCVGNGNDDVPPTGDLVYTTTDGSNIRVELSYSTLLPGCTIASDSDSYWTCRQWRVFLPDGSEVRGYGKSARTFVDRNGNETYLSPYVNSAGNAVDLIEDQAGRFIEIEKFVSPRKDVIRRFGFGQQLLEWEIQYQTIQTVDGVFYLCADNVPPPSNYCVFGSPGNPMSHEVVSKIKFPAQTVNGLAYSFDFEYSGAAQNGWGELRTAYFPSRITATTTTRARLDFQYVWDGYTTTAINQLPMRDVTRKLENPIKKRTLSYTSGDGFLRSEVWDYTFTDISSTTTLPDGSQQTASFGDVSQSWAWTRGLVSNETMPYGRSVSRIWQRNPPLAPIAANAAANAYVSSETTSLGTRASQAKTSTRTFTVDRNGNQTQVVESDWLASPLRRREAVYLNPTTVANGAVPTVDEVNAYWRAGPRRSVRAVKRQRTVQLPAAVTRSLTEFAYDANWNVTQSRQWDSTKLTTAPPETGGDILNAANAVIQQSNFTPTGNPTSAIDANVNQSTYSYGSISGCSPTQPTVSDLYPTSKVEGANNTAIQRNFSLSYDCNTGVVTSETDVNNSDANGTVTTSRGYDAFGRPLVVTAPDGSRTEWFYQDGNYRTAEYRDVSTAADKRNTTIRHFDDLGRLFLQQTSSTATIPGLTNATEGILVDQLYEPPCRVPNANCDTFRYEAVSIPYRVNGPDPRGWTRTKIDALSRPVEVQYFTGETKPFPWAGNVTSTGTETMAYNADQTITTDAAGRQRISEVDGFGRLIRVVEDPNGLNYSTSYEYDVLDNLTRVVQGNRIRDFEYTSLSRLRSTTQPETGSIFYTYDNNGNLLTKSDGRGTMSISGYDALNRMLSKSWTVANTPAVQYSYDNCTQGKGRLCGATAVGVSTSSFEYDTLGRPVKKTQTIGGTAYVMQQGYLLSGAVAWMMYPTGTLALPRKVSYEYWPNGQTKGVWQGETGSGSRYATVESYHAAGQESSVRLGNLLQEETTLNPRLQVSERKVTFNSAFPNRILWTAGYDYGSPNDGNLKTQTITGWLPPFQTFNFTQTYTYDNLSRLRTMKDSGLSCGPDANTNQRYVYDRHGNKANLSSASTCGEASGAAVPFVANDLPADVEAIFPANRISNSNPDGSGNQQNWAGRTFIYDGENRVYQANLSPTSFYRYNYDGEGRRVSSQRFTLGNPVPQENTYFIYDASGQLLSETDGVTPLGPNPERKYLTADPLGSTRLVTKSSGTANTIVDARFDYYPFGEAITRSTAGYAGPAVRPRFTGQLRDSETGLDYFGARYMAGSMGRFTSPDPSPLGVSIQDPQSWNLYSNVRNRTTTFVDTAGLWATYIHADINSIALSGYLSAGQISALNQRAYDLDRDNSTAGANDHALRRPDQNPEQGRNAIWSRVASEMRLARPTGSTLTDFDVWHLGNAIHAVQDMTSPSHTSNAGEPGVWSGLTLGVIGHAIGEGLPSVNWSRIGVAIRFTLATLVQAAPEYAASRGLTSSNIDAVAARRISDFVSFHFRMGPKPNRPVLEDAARQCALGNQAACGIESGGNPF
ncbi:MAG: RHS repeat-associated core domain-containing protein [Bryobacteraceae bacterium]|nr:RHS repeat-associated core domain-containing protein [Bryobacteraceae bacterium]